MSAASDYWSELAEANELREREEAPEAFVYRPAFRVDRDRAARRRTPEERVYVSRKARRRAMRKESGT